MSWQLRAKAEIELRQREKPKLPPLWQPNPDEGDRANPQRLALESEADILFFGGQAGGGKTDLLLGAALTRHRKAIIFRREYPQLKDVISRAVEIVGHDNGLNRNDNLWRNLPGGRSLELGAVQREDDKNKYKGRPHDLKGFDEITEFTESQFRFLIGWMRTTNPNQRTRVICTGNPPTNADGQWVIDFWAPWLDDSHPNPAQPGELRWYAMVDGKEVERPDGRPFQLGDETITPMSRTFIPASVYQNPHLRNTDYVTTLQALPEPLRSMLLKGLFNTVIEDDPWQVIPTEWVRQAQARWEQRPQPDKTPDAIGADIARGGKDKTAIAKRYDNWFSEVVAYPGAATDDGPKAAAVIAQEIEGEPDINIDLIGVGTSVYDILKGQDIPNVHGINVAEASGYEDTAGKHHYAYDRSGKFKLKNKRAEIHWKFREALDPQHGDDIALPPGNELRADLCAARYKIVVGGIQVELKDDIKQRLGRSPDLGEAILLAAYIPPTPPDPAGETVQDIDIDTYKTERRSRLWQRTR